MRNRNFLKSICLHNNHKQARCYAKKKKNDLALEQDPSKSLLGQQLSAEMKESMAQFMQGTKNLSCE